MKEKEILIHNERTKLRATFFNNVGIAIIAGGAFGLIWQHVPGTEMKFYTYAIEGMAGFAGLMSHLAGIAFLKALRV
jgi:hypothetical protein